MCSRVTRLWAGGFSLAQIDLVIPKVFGCWERTCVPQRLFLADLFGAVPGGSQNYSGALTLREKPWVGGPWSHSSLLPVWLFGEQFLENGWLSRWSERKSEKFHVLHLPVCTMPTILSPQPAQSLQFPQTDAFQQHPPFTLLGALFSQLASCLVHELLVLCHHVLQARWDLPTSAARLL